VPGGPNHPVFFRPQGFSPSRRLAPLATYRAYFISNPPMGFALRGFVPSASPYALSDAAPLLWLPLSAETLPDPTSGSSTPRKSRPGPWGLARCPTDASLGFSPSEVSSPLRLLWRRNAFAVPSRALLARPHADRTTHASGSLPLRGQPLSLDSDVPPWSFLPRRPSQLFVDADVLGCPSADPPCRHGWHSPLRTPSSPAGAR